MTNSANTIVYNEYIKSTEVRVIDDDGTQLGVMETSKARSLAYNKNLDLVVITLQSNPPVARIVDVAKYTYEQKKRQKDAEKKARQNVVEVKEVKIRPGIGIHDLEIKMKQVMKFLEANAKVKITIPLRGREITKGSDVIASMIDDIASLLSNFKYEQELKQSGNRITGVITKDG
jgi:translation initiation factor IF-3